MTRVTPASIAYIATQVRNLNVLIIFANALVWQVRFALSSSSVFSRTDMATDSERFYNSVLLYFEDVDEKEEVDKLLGWWNQYEEIYCFKFWANGRVHRQIFPGYSSAQRAPTKDGARAIMKEKRALKKRALAEAEVLSQSH
jgi:hypothetical protein